MDEPVKRLIETAETLLEFLRAYGYRTVYNRHKLPIWDRGDINDHILPLEEAIEDVKKEYE